MSETPPSPADPVTAETVAYAAIVDEFRGHRRAGASLVEAAALTAFWRLALNLASQGQQG